MIVSELSYNNHIAVLGAGRMGHAIAYAAAAKGALVTLFDPSPESLSTLPVRFKTLQALLGEDDGVEGRITATSSLPAAVAEATLVIEAVPELPDVKRELFLQLDTYARPDAILASNTSAIPIAQIAEPVRDRSRVVGAHFWNPPHLVTLVEVVQMGPENEPAVLAVMKRLEALGWSPVHVRRDIPGFVGNRMQHALKREAIALVASGVCDAETVDTVVKLGFGSRLGVLGPLEQSDMLGLNLTCNIHDVLLHDLDRTPHTQDYLKDLIARGETGMAAGKGFRAWTPEAAQAVRDRLDRALSAQAQTRRTGTVEREDLPCT